MSNMVPMIRFRGFTDDWEERKLTDIVSRLSKSSNNSELPKIEFEDIVAGEGRLNKDVSHKFDDRKGILFESQNILYGKLRPYLKNWLLADFKGIALGDFWVFKSINSDPKFVYSLIQSNHYQKVANDTSGTKMPRSDWKKVSSTDFPTPSSLEEQQKIGSFFKQLDNTIALHQRILDLLKKQKKGFLQKMFPKNGAKVPELRFEGFTDDWEERKLGDYIIQYSEKTKQNNQYPVFTSSRNGLFFQKDYYKGNQIASEDNIGYNIVPRGYFTYRHMSDDLVFKFNINDLADYGIVSTLYPVFTTNEQLDSKYLQYQLNEGSEFRRFSLLQKQGGSRTYMYLNKLQNMILTIPKLEEQQKIGSFFKQLDDTIALHQRMLDLLKKQKKGFLQKMFIS